MREAPIRSAPRSATGSEIRALLALAAPLTLTNLGQIAMMTTDVLIIATLGPHALAASALGSALLFTLWMFGVGTVTAVAPLVAQARGRGRDVVGESRRTVQQGIWLAVLVSLPCIGLLMLAGPILRWMGQDPALVADTETFLAPLMWCLPPSLCFIALRTFLAALERTRPAVLVTFAAIFFNALGNWVLIHGKFGFPALGLFGAGLASALASLFMAVVLGLVFALDPGLRRYRVWPGIWRADWRRLRELLAIGVPIGAMMTLECALFSGATLVMGLIGAAPVAAHQIALQCASVTFRVRLTRTFCVARLVASTMALRVLFSASVSEVLPTVSVFRSTLTTPTWKPTLPWVVISKPFWRATSRVTSLASRRVDEASVDCSCSNDSVDSRLLFRRSQVKTSTVCSSPGASANELTMRPRV